MKPKDHGEVAIASLFLLVSGEEHSTYTKSQKASA